MQFDPMAARMIQFNDRVDLGDTVEFVAANSTNFVPVDPRRKARFVFPPNSAFIRKKAWQRIGHTADSTAEPGWVLPLLCPFRVRGCWGYRRFPRRCPRLSCLAPSGRNVDGR